MIAAIRALDAPIRAKAGFPRRTEARLSTGTSKGPNTKVDWADLIGRVASAGDREAFKRLFEHFAPRIKGLMLKAGCSSDEAEEIAQNTLIAVWRKAGQFDPATAGAAAWIFTIARNLRIDSFRHESRPQIDPDDPALVPAPAPTPDTTLHERLDGARIRAAMAGLPPEQREVVRLSFFEHDSHAAMAARLGVPLGTIKSRLRLAFQRMRVVLADLEGARP